MNRRHLMVDEGFLLVGVTAVLDLKKEWRTVRYDFYKITDRLFKLGNRHTDTLLKMVSVSMKIYHPFLLFQSFHSN